MPRGPAGRVGSRSLDRDPATGRILPSRARVDAKGEVHWYRADGKPLGKELQKSLTDSFRGADRDRYRRDRIKAIAKDPLTAPKLPGERGDKRARKGARGMAKVDPSDFPPDGSYEEAMMRIAGGSGDLSHPTFFRVNAVRSAA